MIVVLRQDCCGLPPSLYPSTFWVYFMEIASGKRWILEEVQDFAILEPLWILEFSEGCKQMGHSW